MRRMVRNSRPNRTLSDFAGSVLSLGAFVISPGQHPEIMGPRPRGRLSWLSESPPGAGDHRGDDLRKAITRYSDLLTSCE